MKRPSSVFFFTFLVLVFSLPVLALTGAEVSPVTALETVSPAVQSATALTERSLSVTFSEPLLAPGMTAPGNYAVSGAGRGTLAPTPDTVTGSGPQALTWTGGEMRDGAAVTVTVSGVQDAVGNPLLPASATASAAGIGVAPVFSALSVTPSSASEGDTVTVTFTASEPLDGDPAVTVNGHPAAWVSGAKAVDFSYTYTVAAEDTPGMASLAVSGHDLAGNMGSLTDDAVLEILGTDPGLPVRAWPLALLLGGIMVLVACRGMTRTLCGNVDAPSWRVLLGQRQPKKAAGSRFYIGRGNVDAPSRRVLPGGGPNAPAKKKSPWRFFLFLAAVLAAQTAFAAPPSVSSVAVVQQDNGAGGTEAVITYDLDAPNGPCDITVSLSKDGGADGYVFPVTSVTGDVSSVAGGAGRQIVWDLRADYPEEALPNARIRLTADDGLVQHTLTYTAGANGTITGVSPQTVNHGADGTAVTAVADVNYHFTQWSDGVLTATRQDLAVGTDLAVTATFAINTYTLTYTAGPGGTVTGDSPQTVPYGGNSTLVTAVPDPGHHFVQWSDGYTGTDRVDSFVIADLTVTAEFAVNTYTLTYTAGANGSITGVSPQTVNHGADGTLVTAVPDVNYHFTQWSDGVLTATRQDLAVTADVTVTAAFAINTHTLTYTAGANGSVTGVSPQVVNHGADGTAVTAVPDVNYHFTQWSDGVLTATRQDLAVGTDLTVTAEFAINTYTLTYTAGANGTITGDSPQTVNHGADGTAVTAVADVGYHFVQWSDGVLTATRQDLAVTGDITVTAEFAINTYTLTYTAGANGSITGVSPQTVNHGADGTLVTAVPDGGFAFSQWSDGVLTAARQDTNVMGDITVTASFVVAAVPPVVTTFAVNSGAATTTNPVVTLNNTATGSPAEYMASESPTFSGASWAAYGVSPSFTLSGGTGGVKTVYFKVRDAALVESGVVSDTINLVERTILLPGGVPLVLRWVPSGSYQMGRYPGEVDSYTSEDPRHVVTLAYGFWMGKYEVTQQQWIAVRSTWPGTAPSATYGSGNTYPAYYISWDDTKNFITSLNTHIAGSGQGPLTVRLPSESEWEYACRGGTATRFYWGDDIGYTQIGTYAWYSGNNSPNGSKAVGGKTGNAFGLFDMSGNVWEWCEDDYHANYTGAPADGSAWIDSPRASHRMIRGGIWNGTAGYCRSAYRINNLPGLRSYSVGFRLAAVQ